MNACSWKPSLVTLHDGRQVLCDSEEWRHETEARSVLAMRSLAARRAYLYGTLDERGILSGGVKQRRGEEALQRLEATIKAIWYASRG